MGTGDWIVLWIGVGMMIMGAWLHYEVMRHAQKAPGVQAFSLIEYLKALKDVPVPNLLIGLGALLVLLAGGYIDITIAATGS